MDEETNRQLDLGLSALLSSMTGETPPVNGGDKPAALSEPPPEGTINEYPILAQASQWGKLIALTESHLGVAPDEVEPRVWWIRAHLGALSMPASFLAAPLDALVRRTIDLTLPERVRTVLKETCDLTLDRLRQVGDREHYDNLLATMLAAGFRVEGDQYSGNRQRSKNGVSTSRLDDRGAARGGASRVSAEVPVPSPLPDLGLRTAKGERLVPQGSGLTRGRTIVGVGVVGILALAGGFWGYPILHSMRIETVSSSEAFVLPAEDRAQVVPALERRDPVGNLSALFYSINQESHVIGGSQGTTPPAQGKKDDGVQPQSVSESQNQQGQSVAREPQAQPNDVVPASGAGAARVAPTGAQGRQGSKERINTSSPVEGPEFRAGATRSRRPPDNRSGGTWGQDGHVGPRMSERGAPGGSYSGGHTVPLPEYAPQYPPVPVDPGSKPLPVQGRRQVVLAGTMVLSEPNYMGIEIGKLHPGDGVDVVGRVGRFLRIRSAYGKDGYVLAQDVDPSGGQ